MRPIPYIALLLVGVALAASAAAAPAARTLAAEPGGRLQVEIPRGDVVVTSHDRNVVVLETEHRGLGASAVTIEFRRDGEGIVIEGHTEAWVDWLRTGPRTEIRVRVPRRFDVKIMTGDGSIEAWAIDGSLVARAEIGDVTAREIRGSADLRTAEGRIVATSIGGKLAAVTSGGRIDVTGVGAGVRADAGGGPIRLGRVGGDVEARTEGGPIEIDGVEGRVDAFTRGGAVLARFSGTPAGRVESRGGEIEVAFPAAVGARLDALSPRGRVLVDHPSHGVATPAPGRVVGPLNGGGATLRLRTSDARIHVGVL